MRMLCNKHSKAVRELQSKIDKLKEEGKDPSLPQKSEDPQVLRATQSNSTVHSGTLRINTSSPPPVGRPLTDSNTGDESFMLLGGQRVRRFFLLKALSLKFFLSLGKQFN